MKNSIMLALLFMFVCASVFAGCQTCCDDVDKQSYIYPDPEPKHDRAYKDQGWALYVEYFNKGTRSEGIHGTLYHDGLEILSEEKGDVIESPLGKMTWMGRRSEVKNVWDPSGWYSENKKWMQHSWVN